MKLPHQKKTCKDCPFRKDSMEEWLGKERMTEILNQQSFVCHKNLKLQCAGHMIIKKEANIFVATAKAMNIKLILYNKAEIFNSEEECINHHEN